MKQTFYTLDIRKQAADDPSTLQRWKAGDPVTKTPQIAISNAGEHLTLVTADAPWRLNQQQANMALTSGLVEVIDSEEVEVPDPVEAPAEVVAAAPDTVPAAPLVDAPTDLPPPPAQPVPAPPEQPEPLPPAAPEPLPGEVGTSGPNVSLPATANKPANSRAGK